MSRREYPHDWPTYRKVVLTHAKRIHSEQDLPGGVWATDEHGFRVPTSVGTGFDDHTRELVWNKPDDFVGLDLTIRYLNLTPAGIPRHPVAVNFRRE